MRELSEAMKKILEDAGYTAPQEDPDGIIEPEHQVYLEHQVDKVKALQNIFLEEGPLDLSDEKFNNLRRAANTFNEVPLAENERLNTKIYLKGGVLGAEHFFHDRDGVGLIESVRRTLSRKKKPELAEEKILLNKLSGEMGLFYCGADIGLKNTLYYLHVGKELQDGGFHDYLVPVQNIEKIEIVKS